MQNETMALAKQHGYDVSPTEVKAALEEMLGTDVPGPQEDGADPTTCVIPFSEAPSR